MANYTVYMHITPNGKRYIGITSKKPEYRWNHGRAYKNNKHFYNAILKYGWDNIPHVIIADNLTKEDACAMEKTLIKEFETNNISKGYNNSIGGECGSLGCKRTKESIEKMLRNRTYETSWAKGKHFTDEHKRKLALAHIGMKHSEESKEKMRQAHKGFVPSWKGQKRSDEYRAKKSIAIRCVETGITYFGHMEAERLTGISHGNISNCIRGKRKTAGGYHWQYV